MCKVRMVRPNHPPPPRTVMLCYRKRGNIPDKERRRYFNHFCKPKIEGIICYYQSRAGSIRVYLATKGTECD